MRVRDDQQIEILPEPVSLSACSPPAPATDGTTLLGADDKAGVAVIMSAAAQLAAHPEIPHGPIRLCFTRDEEIGHGLDHLDLKKLEAVCPHTLARAGEGIVDFALRPDLELFGVDTLADTLTGPSGTIGPLGFDAE